MTHTKYNTGSQFSKDARGHQIKLENIVEPILNLPKKTKFCKYVGTKYDCCKKVCFENSPCKVRDYRNKYKL